MMKKENIRAELQDKFDRFGVFQKKTGRMAERLRGVTAYRNAETVFVAAAVFLQQVRINCLLDGKNLIVPASGLKDGFYSIKPHKVMFKDLNQAVSVRGLPNFGIRLPPEKASRLNIEIMLTDALAVDPDGGRLGFGHGFFDLSYALLGEMGALTSRPPVFAVISEEQLIDKQLPIDPWDVKMTGVITSDYVRFFSQTRHQPPKIFWKKLPLKRIRKIHPLWNLYPEKRKKE